LKASSSMTRALLEWWERLIAERVPYGTINPDYGRAGLGEKWLILADNERARSAIETAVASTNYCDHKLIGLWLRLNAPIRAVDLIKNHNPTNRGYCMMHIAKWYKTQGNAKQAAAAAASAAEDLLAAKQYDKLVEAVGLLAELKQPDTARH